MPCVVSAMSQLENDPIQNAVHSAAAAKKRKRTRKVYTDKKFVCTHDSCGKSYSRAEHLYRHQLNHTPKQIYRCDFPDCYRSFVRQDLCIRHRERHTTRGSQLQKRDHFAQAASHLHGKPLVPSNAEAFSASGRNGSRLLPATSKLEQLPSPTVSDHGRPIALTSSSSSSSPQSGPVGAYPSYSYPQTGVEWSDYGFSQSTGSSSHAMTSPSTQSTATYGHYAPMSGRSSPHTSVSSGELGQESQMHMQANDCVTTTGGSQTINAPYHHVTTNMNGSSLVHPTGSASMPVGSGYNHDLSMGTAASTPATTLGGGLNTGMITAGSTVSDNFDSLSPCAYPVLGSGAETYNRTTPFGMADDFAAWLFNDGRGAAPATAANGMMPNYLESAQQMPNPFFLSEPSFNGVFNHMLTQHPMSVTSLLESSSTTSSIPATQTILSPKKRQDLLHLISTRFNEAAYSTGAKRKDSLMTGDLDNGNHVLSLRMIQAYLGSYWSHIHPQLPILHLPTFIPDQTPSLLLLAMIALGASTLQHGSPTSSDCGGTEVIERAAELANFIAWHLRWELFMDADFQPPAKLWVFQALLLLEVHEKRYSTRALHERAHIHHDTTLTLMRRGSSLFTTNSTVGETDEHSSWANWIQAEGRRRVAFAALVLDATHATMFGHSVKMVAHELRLPLPCDEAIWSAPSAVDVVRMQGNHQPAPLFLDGLKKTLTGETVRTNAFGRSVLMAGLLSVSWHMNQRDLQMTSLGVPQVLGGRDKWRASLLRAFDNWHRDYDEPYEHAGVPLEPTPGYSADILHGLAHIASHVDIVDCQIFAGAGRLMGRTITDQDFNLARDKMIAWAAKASARDATFHALKVLTRVLGCSGGGGLYSAGDDSLLHRPWVVYMAALVVWCYGYALDGPLSSSSSLSSSSMTMSKSEQIQNMQDFLRRVGGVHDPNELQTVSRRNDCLGLLMVLRDSFMQQQRWELMEEAAGLLGSCIGKLHGI